MFFFLVQGLLCCEKFESRTTLSNHVQILMEMYSPCWANLWLPPSNCSIWHWWLDYEVVREVCCSWHGSVVRCDSTHTPPLLHTHTHTHASAYIWYKIFIIRQPRVSAGGCRAIWYATTCNGFRLLCFLFLWSELLDCELISVSQMNRVIFTL